MVSKQDTPPPRIAKERTEAIPWKMSAGLFEMTNLRPCKVIAREPIIDRYAPQMQQQQQPGKGNMFYTAIIQNRPGLPPNERIVKAWNLPLEEQLAESFLSVEVYSPVHRAWERALAASSLGRSHNNDRPVDMVGVEDDRVINASTNKPKQARER